MILVDEERQSAKAQHPLILQQSPIGCKHLITKLENNWKRRFDVITNSEAYDVFNQCPRKLKKRSLRGYGGHGVLR